MWELGAILLLSLAVLVALPWAGAQLWYLVLWLSGGQDEDR